MKKRLWLQIIAFCLALSSFAAHAADIAAYPGVFTLVAKHSGKVADVQNGNAENGANVWQWFVNGSDAQRWQVNHVADGYYSFKNLKSGKFLGVENAGTTNGTNVRQWEWTGTCAQLWKITHMGQGFHKIANKCSGKLLDVAGGPTATGDGANIQIWDAVGTNANQQWRIESVPGKYPVIAKHSGKAADVEYGRGDNGTNIWQWSLNTSDAQRWDIRHVEDGYFSFKNVMTNKMMSVENAGTANGTNVRQWEWTGTCAQLWKIVSVGDNYFKIANKCSGRALDVRKDPGSDATRDGTNIQIYDYIGWDNQKWRLQNSSSPADDGQPWSCPGSWGTTKVAGGDYFATSFGCWVDANGVRRQDSGDNCIPACLAKAQSSGLCAGLSGPECEYRTNWYAADAGRYGCLARLKVTNPKNGRSAIVVALDYGPACSVERSVSHGIIDLSSRATQYLFGGQVGAVDRAQVVVTEVSPTTPLGPL